MSDIADKVNPLLLQLIISLQSAAMYQMGKTVSPISGKIEKDLDQAKISIDLLSMIQEKTKGNLLDEEKRILDMTVSNLQMNYIDEVERAKSAPEPGEDSATDEKEEAKDTESPTEKPEENK